MATAEYMRRYRQTPTGRAEVLETRIKAEHRRVAIALVTGVAPRRRTVEQQRVTNHETRQRGRRALWALKDAPCMDCGVKYPPYVMDFDHRDPTTKRGGVGQLIGRRRLMLDEIAKCDLVCANCHRIRTFNRRSKSA